ncbi:MAG TPA: hypothetical protein VE775_00495, partial [Pyrinomonadaceae bacterium]|nr:hypothetical protein [Pyrinomonadaceae bacterium]
RRAHKSLHLRGAICQDARQSKQQLMSGGVEVLRRGGDTQDAVIQGVNIVELDPKDNSVGYGGLPNERGEEVIYINGARTVVEYMRRGSSPEQACLDALKLIAACYGNNLEKLKDIDVNFYALNKRGEYAGAAIWSHTVSSRGRSAAAISPSPRGRARGGWSRAPTCLNVKPEERAHLPGVAGGRVTGAAWKIGGFSTKVC